MICLSDHQTISPSVQFPMPKAIFIESAIYSRILVVQDAYIEFVTTWAELFKAGLR